MQVFDNLTKDENRDRRARENNWLLLTAADRSNAVIEPSHRHLCEQSLLQRNAKASKELIRVEHFGISRPETRTDPSRKEVQILLGRPRLRRKTKRNVSKPSSLSLVIPYAVGL